MRSVNRITWPEGKQFAFSIVDDTDRSTLPGIKAVYDVLADNGIRSTKTVWPLRPLGKAITGGESLEDPAYRCWVDELRRSGFEIALHGVSDEPSPRQRIIEGFDRFRDWAGADPEMYVNHVGQREGMYWGASRFDFPVRQLYSLSQRVRKVDPHYCGHVAGSPHFWGDLCQERVRFVRGLVWRNINTLRMDPLMPYHDARRPYVRYWYSASHGSSVQGFCRLISEANQDRLASEGGACIVYTHLGSTFYPLNNEFVRLVERLGRLGGWYVPVSTLLHHVATQRGWGKTADHPLIYRQMQLRWLYEQVHR